MMFLSIRQYIYIGITILILGTSFYFYRNYKNMKEDIISLNSKNHFLQIDNSRLLDVNKSNVEVINNLQNKILENEKNTLELRQKFEEKETYKNRLSKKLSNHNLKKLSQAKPKLIEKRINNATKNVFSDIESITH